MHCTGQKKNGFTLLEMLVIVAVVALLAAIVIPVYNSALEKTREAVCIANRRSLYAVLSMKKLTDKLDTLEDALDAYEAEGKNLPAEYPCLSGGVISVEGDAVICSIHGHEGSKTYFSGISEGTIQDYRSVLIDFSETVPAYLGEMYKLEVLSSGKLNGFWETEGAGKSTNLRAVFQAIIAESGAEYTGSFSNAAVWLEPSDHSKVACIEYKVGNNAYVYYSSGNTYVLANSAFSNVNNTKVGWENNEQAVLDAINSGRGDVSALPAS